MYYKIGKDEKMFQKIIAMKDGIKKLRALSNFMFKVVPYSLYWNKAREESKRLIESGVEY